MSLLVETIRVENGKMLNISFHNERMIRSIYEIFGIRSSIDLCRIIEVPEYAQSGVYKCRVVYDDSITLIEFLPYVIRQVSSLRLVFDDEISYSYKYINRDKINMHYESRGNCDDILIVKNGLVTDSSYANVIFRNSDGSWVTPATCLLQGTRRANLIKQGLISESTITYNDICSYSGIKIINAMLDIEDTDEIPVRNIL